MIACKNKRRFRRHYLLDNRHLKGHASLLGVQNCAQAYSTIKEVFNIYDHVTSWT